MASEGETCNDNASVNIKVKAPKRIVHYGDCIVEEYSEDETDSCQNNFEMEATVDAVCVFIQLHYIKCRWRRTF